MIGELQEAYVTAVEKAAVSVVNVGSATGLGGPPFWRHRRRGFGSGVVYDGNGHILTNRHVVGEAEKILVTLNDGRVLGGTPVGGDGESDIAVVKVEAENLQPAELGDSNDLKLGQPVLAIGNPLGLAGGPTVTSGVISSLRRSLWREWFPYGDGLKVIQTDAAVNPGNSGGPLVDLKGRLVAITTAQMPWADGIGFAVPINTAKEVADQLIEHGHVPRPWMGIAGTDVSRPIAARYGLSVTHGVLVTEVKAGSPAENAGIRVGDVIVALAGKTVTGLGELLDTLRETKIGDAVHVEADRQGRRLRLQLTAGTRPF